MKKAERIENKESKDDKPYVNAEDVGAIKDKLSSLHKDNKKSTLRSRPHPSKPQTCKKAKSF